MTTCHSLKMRNERVVYDSAANRADDRDSLRRSLFRDHKSEAGPHLCEEAHERWSPFLGNAMPESLVEFQRDEFNPKSAMNPDRLSDVELVMQDAVAGNFLDKPLTAEQLAEFIQIPPR